MNGDNMMSEFDFTKISGAIFDMDGTILDSSDAWVACPRLVLGQWGYEPKPDLDEKLFPLRTEEVAPFLKDEYNMTQSEEEILNAVMASVERYYNEEATLKPGAKECLEYLKSRGVKLVLATATVESFAIPALKLTGIADLFDHILTCDVVGYSKQEPQFFQECMKRLGTPPESTWLFEDALHSVRTAEKFGLILCGVADFITVFLKPEMMRTCHFFLEDFRQWKELPFVQAD